MANLTDIADSSFLITNTVSGGQTYSGAPISWIESIRSDLPSHSVFITDSAGATSQVKALTSGLGKSGCSLVATTYGGSSTAHSTVTSSTASSSPTAAYSGSHQSLNAAAIGGGVAGGVVLLGLVGAAVYFLRRRKHKSEERAMQTISAGGTASDPTSTTHIWYRPHARRRTRRRSRDSASALRAGPFPRFSSVPRPDVGTVCIRARSRAVVRSPRRRMGRPSSLAAPAPRTLAAASDELQRLSLTVPRAVSCARAFSGIHVAGERLGAAEVWIRGAAARTRGPVRADRSTTDARDGVGAPSDTGTGVAAERVRRVPLSAAESGDGMA